MMQFLVCHRPASWCGRSCSESSSCPGWTKDQTLSLQVQPQNHRSRLMDQDIGDYSNSNAKTSEDMIDRHSEKLYEY